MGSRLDHGSISNGCLACPYHGIRHTSSDAFGTTMVFEDKLWWSYSPSKAKPPATPYHKNKNFNTIMFTLEMDANVKDCIYNTLDINHFGFIHNNLFGQKHIVPNEYKYTKHANDKLSLKYNYKTNTNMMNIKSDLDDFQNYQIFQYPYTSTAIVSLANKDKLVIDINMTPSAPNKTKLIVTLKHNFWKSYVQRIKLDLVIKYILHQDKRQMSKQALDNMLKKKHMNKYILRNEEHFKELNKMFKNFEYPDMISVMRLYNYHNYNYDDLL
jgi:phenylpropionate dioxygenase-like ring-hydroxylating dioxygenase large terminal subunit